jgi:hypothetical protein
MAISIELRRLLDERDKQRCAYCLTTEENCGLRMHVDHIVPETAGGLTILDNLCLARFTCNNYKQARQTGIDPLSGQRVPLFHPVKQLWSEHFTWDNSKTKIIGLTASGRATVTALHLNNFTVVIARHRWTSAGWHPPHD